MSQPILSVVFERHFLRFWRLSLLLAGLGMGMGWETGRGQSATDFSQPMLHLPWVVTRTAHFNIYSCGTSVEVNKLAARLEQFCQTYAMLAGSQAVASPPTIVMAFPSQEAMTPFLPLYEGKPGNLAGFFTRGHDENLIVLALPDGSPRSQGMDVIYHEYTHLLLRRNDRIWPLWLDEGMAEIYSTFTTEGYTAQIARPIEHHLRLLQQQPMMPFHELFAVNHDSPQYNERERQGVFYAESWLLTHFLMVGDNSAFRSRFGMFTQLLQAGQLPEQAFTNAMGVPLSVMEAQLHAYLQQGVFSPITLSLTADVAGPVYVSAAAITPVEMYFRLGDELLRINRPDAAEALFIHAKTLAPASPLPYEGLGLLAAQRNDPNEALSDLQTALMQGSTSFLAHYIYAQQKYQLTADAEDRYSTLKKPAANEIRNHLEESIALMPNFAPAHELLGFFEMVQGQDPAAEQQLGLAIQLEPENPAYLITLAQLQIQEGKRDAARQTLQPLLLPSVDAKLRAPAEDLIQKISGSRS